MDERPLIKGDMIMIDATDAFTGVQLGIIMLQTHGPWQCEGRPCCIHHPSYHHMRQWRQNWRADRGLMERMCDHGIGHPDPDDIAYKRSIGRGDSLNVHDRCDGCCAPPPEDR